MLGAFLDYDSLIIRLTGQLNILAGLECPVFINSLHTPREVIHRCLAIYEKRIRLKLHLRAHQQSSHFIGPYIGSTGGMSKNCF